MRLIYKLNIIFVFGFKFVMRMLCGGGDTAAPTTVSTPAVDLPPSNILKQKIKIHEIIFYPVATMIDKFQAQVHITLIMLCHSHHNLIGREEKYARKLIEKCRKIQKRQKNG